MINALPRAGSLLTAALLILVVAVAGNFLARSVWLLLEPVPTITARVNWDLASGQTASDGPTVQERARAVATGQWFGEVAPEQVAAEPEPVRPVSMPETRLQLELRGVMAGDTPTQGSALIAQRSNDSAMFRIGETIFNQAELLEVYGDRVVIRRDGALETLSFEPAENTESNSSSASAGSAENSNAGSSSVAQAPSRQPRSPSASNNPRTASEQAPSSATNSQRPNSTNSAQQRLDEEIRQALTEVQARAQSDPNSLLRQYGLEATDNGYRVTPRAGILIANGLRPGDRITQINDQPVGNVDRDQILVDSVLASEQIKITLERSGATYTFYQSLPGL